MGVPLLDAEPNSLPLPDPLPGAELPVMAEPPGSCVTVAGRLGIFRSLAWTLNEVGEIVWTMDGATGGGATTVVGSATLEESPPAGGGGAGGGGGIFTVCAKVVESTSGFGALKIIRVASMKKRIR